MFRLTLRGLLARKVRLLMSGLAIVLGIGFLTGVLVFSNGLNATFDGIIKGSVSDGLVRPENSASSFENVQAGTSRLTPDDVARFDDLPEVERAVGSVDGIGAYLLDDDGKLVSTGGAPTLAFNYTDAESLLGEPVLTLLDGDWPETPTEVVLDSNAAERAGYTPGDEVAIIAPSADSLEGTRTTLTMTGTAEFNGGGTAGAILLLLSTEGAQQLFLDGEDAFTTASLTAAPGVGQAELADAAQEVAPDGYRAVEGDTVVEESQSAVGQFLDVITQFLVAFAVIAILVGGFIIANTFSILIAQRARELALLRAVGAGAAQVRRSVLLEALVMAVVGASLGIALGLLLARSLAVLFSEFGLSIAGSALQLTIPTVVAGYTVGLLVTMVSAYLPARRASRVPPVAALRDEAAPAEGSMRRRAVLGFGVIAIGVGLTVVGLRGAPGPDAAWVGAAAVLWIVAVAALTPIIGMPVLAFFRSAFERLFGPTGRLAGENARRNPRRTGATASALMIGLALVSAVGTLAASFSATADDLVDSEFRADFLVQSANFASFPTAIGDEMEQVAGVEFITRDQFTGGLVDGEPGAIFGITENFDEIYSFDVLEGTGDLGGRRAVLTDSAADTYDVELGDTLPVAFGGGQAAELTVTGIVEQSPGFGPVNISMRLLEELGVQRSDTSVSIEATPGADLGTLQADLEEVIADVPIVSVQNKEEFAQGIRDQINQLLYLIYGLLALAIVIAVIGIVNTLGLSVIERTREIGLLRAVGLSRSRLRRMITLESVTIAVMGALLGMAVGLIIGVLLREVLKEDLTALALPLENLGIFLAVAVVVGVLAAIIPAVRASRMKVLEAIATE